MCFLHDTWHQSPHLFQLLLMMHHMTALRGKHSEEIYPHTSAHDGLVLHFWLTVERKYAIPPTQRTHYNFAPYKLVISQKQDKSPTTINFWDVKVEKHCCWLPMMSPTSSTSVQWVPLPTMPWGHGPHLIPLTVSIQVTPGWQGLGSQPGFRSGTYMCMPTIIIIRRRSMISHYILSLKENIKLFERSN